MYWATYNRASRIEDVGNTLAELILCQYDHSLMNKDTVEINRMALVKLVDVSIGVREYGKGGSTT